MPSRTLISNKSFDGNRATLNEDCPIGGAKRGHVYSLFLDCRLPQQFFLDSVVQLVSHVGAIKSRRRRSGCACPSGPCGRGGERRLSVRLASHFMRTLLSRVTTQPPNGGCEPFIFLDDIAEAVSSGQRAPEQAAA